MIVIANKEANPVTKIGIFNVDLMLKPHCTAVRTFDE
jgi:hypothetical protein